VDLGKGNLFSALAQHATGETFTDLITLPHIKIERIVSTGQATAAGEWLAQERAEWVLLVSGSAALRFEGETGLHEMQPGDFVLIPPLRRHRVERTASDMPSLWLAVHFEAIQ